MVDAAPIQETPEEKIVPQETAPPETDVKSCEMVLAEFTPDDFVLWFTNFMSLDKPRQILARAPYFAPSGWEEGEMEWVMGLSGPVRTDTAPKIQLDDAAKSEVVTEKKEEAGGDRKDETVDTAAEHKADAVEAKEVKEEGPGPALFRAFIAARDAYLDANEDYYDSLEERGLSWHQEEYDRDVLPKSKAALEARWDMIRFYCQVEGIKVPPPQETAVAYAGELYRGYP